MDIAPDELAAVRERLERDDLTVMAYRFEGDRFCTAQRFAAYAEALGDRFVARVLPDSAANPDDRRRSSSSVVACPAQRGHRPPDRRRGPADDRRARRDPVVLHATPRHRRLIPSFHPRNEPMRQWVLSLPFELRAPAAFDPSVRSALVRICDGRTRSPHTEPRRPLSIRRQPEVIANVRVFDGDVVHPPTTVLVDGSRIRAIGAPPPSGAELVDGTNATLLPGLINAHVHTNEAGSRTAPAFTTSSSTSFGPASRRARRCERPPPSPPGASASMTGGESLPACAPICSSWTAPPPLGSATRSTSARCDVAELAPTC